MQPIGKILLSLWIESLMCLYAHLLKYLGDALFSVFSVHPPFFVHVRGCLHINALIVLVK